MARRDKIENLEDLIADSIGGEVVDQKVSSLLPPGENYGSVMYKVDFKVKKGDKIEEYHAVAKCTPLNPFTQELFNTQVTLKAEIAWYTTIIPTLKAFPKEFDFAREIDFFQEFYGARISLDPTSDKVDLDGLILTQNLKYLGYYNVKRDLGFDLPTTYTILRDLATFHTVALALKHHEPDVFEKKVKRYLFPTPKFNEEMHQTLLKQILYIYEHIPECAPFMERMEKYLNNTTSYGHHPMRDNQWTTLIHCDFWSNNIMVTGGENSKNMILDLQTPFLGSPAIDLMFFLLTSVHFEVIQDQMDHLIEYYHRQFLDNLARFKISTEEYSLDELTKEIQEEVAVGEVNHALNHIVMMLTPEGNANFDSSNANFKREDVAKPQLIPPNEKHIEKFKWVMMESVKRNWI